MKSLLKFEGNQISTGNEGNFIFKNGIEMLFLIFFPLAMSVIGLVIYFYISVTIALYFGVVFIVLLARSIYSTTTIVYLKENLVERKYSFFQINVWDLKFNDRIEKMKVMKIVKSTANSESIRYELHGMTNESDSFLLIEYRNEKRTLEIKNILADFNVEICY